jgi:hypothetical protein
MAGPELEQRAQQPGSCRRRTRTSPRMRSGSPTHWSGPCLMRLSSTRNIGALAPPSWTSVPFTTMLFNTWKITLPVTPRPPQSGDPDVSFPGNRATRASRVQRRSASAAAVNCAVPTVSPSVGTAQSLYLLSAANVPTRRLPDDRRPRHRRHRHAPRFRGRPGFR